MKTKGYILVLLALVALVVALIAPQLCADYGREYRIKAAFLYNFIKFIDWPKEKIADDSRQIIIGIIGDDPFDSAFEPVKDKPVKGRKVLIKYFKGYGKLKQSDDKNEPVTHPEVKALRQCHLLFICSSEKDNLSQIIESLKGSSVLTVSDTTNFLDAGGIINFRMTEKKVAFEINLIAAEKANLKIRSQLVRLAKKVIKEKAVSKKDEKSNAATHTTGGS